MSKIGLIPKYSASWAEVSRSKWVKNPEPIIKPGPPGSFDDGVVASPYVLKKPNGSHSLYYMAQNKEGTKWGIGLATSRDLVNWKKWQGNPLLTEDMIGWGRKIDGPFINKLDNQYYLFYEAAISFHLFQQLQSFVNRWGLSPIFTHKLLRKLLNRFLLSRVSVAAIHTHSRGIGFVTSDNGRLWKDYSLNPVFQKNKRNSWESMGVFAPKVYKIGDTYWMYYSGSDGKKVCSGLALSSNLREWQRYQGNPLLETGPKGTWDEQCAEIISLVQAEDGYVLFYEGEDAKNVYRIGAAYSTDLLKWEKFDSNPIIEIGKTGSFDDRTVNAPYVVVHKNKLHLLYSAFNTENRGSIGLATLDFKE